MGKNAGSHYSTLTRQANLTRPTSSPTSTSFLDPFFHWRKIFFGRDFGWGAMGGRWLGWAEILGQDIPARPLISGKIGGTQGISGDLWLIMIQYGSFYGSSWLLVAHYGSLWFILAHYCSLWLIMAHHDSLKLTMTQHGSEWLIMIANT